MQETIKRLKEYVENDKIYNEYQQNKHMALSDFDKFCIQHCQDIENIVQAYEKPSSNNDYKKFQKYVRKMNAGIIYHLANHQEELAFYTELVHRFNEICKEKEELQKQCHKRTKR